ncbi:MAG TPA: GntR family transcriptional regulator [Pseudolabrys sp.]|nr:GntR family transcriptional regulator [Pseudolabrys sp.]
MTPRNNTRKLKVEREVRAPSPTLEKNVPLHREVANKLMAAIQDGTYPVGSLLPTENELAAKYNVSRHTLRESVRQLQALNLVTRRQGHGTIVKSDKVQREFKLAIRTFSDIENHGYFTHLVLVRSDTVIAKEALARELGCQVGEAFLHVLSRRVPIDGSIPLPTAWNETYIIEAYASIRAQMGMHKGPIYNLIERTFGERIEAIEQDVSAVELTAEVARVLSARPRSPGLRVKRTYFGRSNRPVMIGYNTYPAEPFRFNMRLEHD